MPTTSHKQVNKKSLFAWVMYDFANSSFTTIIVTFVYAAYFTKAIAPDPVTGTALWGKAITISALVVAFFSPLLGAIADQGNKRRFFLFLCTAIAIFSSTMLYTALPGETTTALIWFISANIAYEMGAVFYNAFLPDIAPLEKIGKVSGLGWGIGYLGGLLAMLLAMLGLVNPETPWFGFTREAGQNIRATTLLVAVWFGVFSLPAFFLLPEEAKQKADKTPFSFIRPFLALKETLGQLLKYRQIVRFLLARLLYNDGLITIFAFGGIYAAGTFNFTFKEIMLFGIVLNIAAGLGALVCLLFEDRLGSIPTISITLWGLIFAAILAVLAPNKTLFWLAGIMVGLFAGPNQSASRAMMAKLIPSEKKSEFFGFFAFTGKSTAFAGPFLLAYVTKMFASQRAGMATVILFFISGKILISKVKYSDHTKPLDISNKL